jgi:hypothetical protein
MKNQHDKIIPAQTLAEVQKLLQQVIDLLSPYALALTPGERQELPKMGEKTFTFVEKAYQFAQQNPSLCPSYLDMKEFGVDFEDADSLRWVQNLARQIKELIDDTAMSAGSEAYQAALVFYRAVKAAAREDIPGAKAVYGELGKRFPQGRRAAPADSATQEP